MTNWDNPDGVRRRIYALMLALALHHERLKLTSRALEKAFKDVTGKRPPETWPEQIDPADRTTFARLFGLGTNARHELGTFDTVGEDWRAWTVVSPPPRRVTNRLLGRRLDRIAAILRALNLFADAPALSEKLSSWCDYLDYVLGQTTQAELTEHWSAIDLGIAVEFASRSEHFLRHYIYSERGPIPFAGRHDELSRLSGWLQNPNAKPRMLITAPAGRGKSALLINWIKSIHTLAMASDSWVVAFVPISVRASTSQPDVFLDALIERLDEIIKPKFPRQRRSGGEQHTKLISACIDELAANGTRVLIIIDGLDEAVGEAIDISFLPASLPINVRVLVSARQLVGDFDSSGWLRRLDWGRTIEFEAWELDPLRPETIEDVMISLGAPMQQLTLDRALVSRLVELTAGEPLMVRFYCEDLWSLTRSGTKITKTDLDNLEPGFDSYFSHWIAQQHLHVPGADIDAALSLLAFALGPLEANDLITLLRRLYGYDVVSEHEILRPLRRFVIGDGGPRRGYVLSHPKIAQYLQSARFRGSSQRIRNGFSDWVTSEIRLVNESRILPSNVPSYALRYLRQHLLDTNAPPAVFMEMVSNGWRKAWEGFELGSVGFGADVRAAWAAVRRASPTNRPGDQWRCALVLSSIRTSGHNVPGSLILAAFNKGILPFAEARQLAAFNQDAADSIATLVALASSPEANANQYSRTIEPALGRLASSYDFAVKRKGLDLLAPHLSREQYADAWVACGFESPSWIRSFLMGIPSAELKNFWRRWAATIARDISAYAYWSAWQLIEAAPHLSELHLKETVLRACAGENEYQRAFLIESLAGSGMTECINELLHAATSIANPICRVQALSAVVPLLTGRRRQTVTTAAIVAAESITEGEEAVAARRKLFGIVSLPKRGELIADAIDILRRFSSLIDRATALRDLSSVLTVDQRRLETHDILEAAHSTEEGERSYIMGLLVEHLPDSLAESALSLIASIRYEPYRSEALTRLASRLPKRCLNDAVLLAMGLESPTSRGLALATLSRMLPPDDRAAIHAKIVSELEDDDAAELGKLLAVIVEHLTSSQLEKALNVTTSVSDQWARSAALESLAPRLSRDQLEVALSAARSINDADVQVHAFAALARQESNSERRQFCLENVIALCGAIKGNLARANAIGMIAELTENQKLTELVNEARGLVSIPENRPSVDASRIAWLLPHLPTATIDQMFSQLRIEDDFLKVLEIFREYLSPDKICDLLKLILRMDPFFVSIHLAYLGPRLSADQSLEAFRAVESSDVLDRARVLSGVREALPLAAKRRALLTTLMAARRETEHESGAWALGLLGGMLKGRRRQVVFDHAIRRAKKIANERSRSDALGRVGPALTTSQVKEALPALEGLRGYHYVTAFVALAKSMTEQDFAECFARAIENVIAMSDPSIQLYYLVLMAPIARESNRSALWESLISTAAQCSRTDVLHAIVGSVDVWRDLGADAHASIARAVKDVCSWYP